MTHIDELWEKAIESAVEARSLLGLNLPTGATSRAYYAIFTAARVVLAEQKGLQICDLRRHATVLRLFSEHFVRPELVDAELGRAIRRLFERRASADYDSPRTAMEQARNTLSVMEQFLAVINALRGKSA